MEVPDSSDRIIDRLDELSHVAEALVFGADEPVRPERIAEVYAEIRGAARPALDEIQVAVDALNQQYESGGHSIRVFRWAEGFRMATIPEVAPFLQAFLDTQRTRRLSRSLMEALAVVAYRQPVTKPEVDFVRGVDSDYALRKLMELDMVDVVGRSDAVGRPLLYGTTSTFLEKFGLTDLESLPNLREVEELLNDPAFNNERARLLLRESLFDIKIEDEQEGESKIPADSAQPPDDSEIGQVTEGAIGVEDAPPANGKGLNGSGS